jgi:tetratricopeptide (TPR) repeat protein
MENDSKILLTTAIGKIKTLMAQDKFVEAHRGCLEILRFDPDNIAAIKIKKKIEAIVKRKNIESLKEDIKNLKPLLEQKKYEELLEHLKSLEPFINDYSPLKHFIIKAQKAYRKDIKHEQERYYEVQVGLIKKLIKEKDYEPALKKAESLQKAEIKLEKTTALMKSIRKQWIESELQSHSQFLKSEKYEDILLFLQKLKGISGKNKKLNNLIIKFKKANSVHNIEKKKDFIFTGTEKIKTLLQLKKYDKAALAAKEILDIDPANKQVRKMFLSANRSEIRRMNKALLKQMSDSTKELKKSYKEEPKKFIKI